LSVGLALLQRFGHGCGVQPRQGSAVGKFTIHAIDERVKRHLTAVVAPDVWYGPPGSDSTKVVAAETASDATRQLRVPTAQTFINVLLAKSTRNRRTIWRCVRA
jgi:hypothetical protein